MFLSVNLLFLAFSIICEKNKNKEDGKIYHFNPFHLFNVNFLKQGKVLNIPLSNLMLGTIS